MRQVRSPLSDLKDSTAKPSFLPSVADTKARVVWESHWVFSITSVSVAPFFRLSRPITSSVLLPSRGPVASFAFAAFLALGARLAAVAFFPFPFADAPLAASTTPLAFLSAFGFAGAASGFAASPRLDTLPDPSSGRRPVLELLDRRGAGQAVPDCDQSFRWPSLCQFPSSFCVANESNGVEKQRRLPQGWRTP
jgi:hypothetical protein